VARAAVLIISAKVNEGRRLTDWSFCPSVCPCMYTTTHHHLHMSYTTGRNGGAFLWKLLHFTVVMFKSLHLARYALSRAPSSLPWVRPPRGTVSDILPARPVCLSSHCLYESWTLQCTQLNHSFAHITIILLSHYHVICRVRNLFLVSLLMWILNAAMHRTGPNLAPKVA